MYPQILLRRRKSNPRRLFFQRLRRFTSTKRCSHWVTTLILAMGGIFLLAPRVFCADPDGVQFIAVPPVVSTHTVLVTNMVVVTNYVITTNVVFSTNDPAPGPVKSPLPDLSWVPPDDRFDWIQLKSGEWLKGRIKAMQDRKLEFDSEELKLMTFDWKDIRQMRTSRYVGVLFEGQETIWGPVAITPELITVGGLEPRTFPRKELQSIAPGGSKERNFWSGKVSVGLTLNSGNSKAMDFNAQGNLQRRTPETRLNLDYIGDVNAADGVENANNHRANAEFDYWLSRRLYAIVPQAEYYKDHFQNIGHRLTVGAGVGYYLIDRPRMEWNISTGPAYQQTWFDSSQPDEPTTHGNAALSFGSKFDWEITRRVDLILEYRGQFTRRIVGETLHHSVSTLDIDLTKRFDLNVSFVWDRIQSPQQDSSGVTPYPDDYRLVFGLGVRF